MLSYWSIHAWGAHFLVQRSKCQDRHLRHYFPARQESNPVVKSRHFSAFGWKCERIINRQHLSRAKVEKLIHYFVNKIRTWYSFWWSKKKKIVLFSNFMVFLAIPKRIENFSLQMSEFHLKIKYAIPSYVYIFYERLDLFMHSLWAVNHSRIKAEMG